MATRRAALVAFLVVVGGRCVPSSAPLQLQQDSEVDGAAADKSLGAGDAPIGPTTDLPTDDLSSTCPAFAAPINMGQVATSQINEASGLVASQNQTDVLWVHNDSGDSARLFAISATGALRASYRLTGVSAVDWEGLALGPGPVAGESYLYIGDIGDNALGRTAIQVHRLVEPLLDQRWSDPPTLDIAAAETFVLVYPQGPRNAETLLVDPWTADILIVTKDGSHPSEIYRAPAPHAAGAPIALALVGTLAFGQGSLGKGGDRLATGGDVSSDGREVLIRTYSSAFLFRRSAGQSLAQALAADPCPLSLIAEPQGESLAFTPDGQGFYTLSEKTHQPLYLYRRF
jgi:hypothetical protein